MKLLLVTDAWYPQTNGVVTTLNTTLNELEKRGITSEVIHPGRFKTIPCPSYPEIRLAINTRKIAKMIEEANADYYHIATEGPLGKAARHYLIKHKRPFQTSFHTKFPEYVNERLPFIPVTWGYALLRRFHQPAINVMVTTKTLQEELASYGIQHTSVWSRGVDTKLYYDNGSSQHNKEPILLYVGRLAVEKNIEDFLRLDVPGQKWVVGDGPQRRQLEKEYPNATFFGYRKGEALMEKYAQADVFVFPSKTDTFGLVMLEAMACGTPVAAYPVTGPKDVVVHGQTGYLDSDLALAIEKAQTIDRSQCRQHAEQHSWAACTDRFMQAFEQPAYSGETA